MSSNDANKATRKISDDARPCRWDRLRPCNVLSREVARWNKTCDVEAVRLQKLVCYLATTVDFCLEGWVGGGAEDIPLVLYAAMLISHGGHGHPNQHLGHTRLRLDPTPSLQLHMQAPKLRQSPINRSRNHRSRMSLMFRSVALTQPLAVLAIHFLKTRRR